MGSEIKDYNKDIEDLFIGFMVSNSDLFIRCKNILKPEYFDDVQNRETVQFIMEYTDAYSSMPAVEQVHAMTGKSIKLIPEIANTQDKWFFKEFEIFCRHKALRLAILSSPLLLDEGRYGEVEANVKNAVQIGLVKDLGLDYYADPKTRLESILSDNGQISTGWRDIDAKLYGGINRGEITIFAGQCVTADTTVESVKRIPLAELRESFATVTDHTRCDVDVGFLVCLYGDSVTYESIEFQSYICDQVRVVSRTILEMCDGSKEWFVTSPDGIVPVTGVISKGLDDIIAVFFKDGTIIKTSPFHCFERSDGEWISTINLMPGDALVSVDGTRTVVGISDLRTKDLVFDLMVDHVNHRYYTAGVSSHNSGAGKSLFLQNLAVNWSFSGLTVVYITLELSEKLCSLRVDAMTTGTETRDVMKNIDNVDLKIRTLHKKHGGQLRIKQLPNGCTATDIRAYIKEYEIQTGHKVDAVLIDYLDLMMPQSKKISAENLFVKDKYVTEEMRNLAVELNIMIASATQLNRGSYDTVEYDPSHISGGISKVNTADNVIGIFTSAAMKESGRYQIQFMKTRSSSGVGSKVDLCFDPKTLRIYDLEAGEENANHAASKSIYESLSRKAVINDKQQVDSDKTPPPNKTLSGAADLRSFMKRKN